MTTFKDEFVAGRATWEAIDDWVEAWHDGDFQEELAAFLGMTETEYSYWAETPEEFERFASVNWLRN